MLMTIHLKSSQDLALLLGPRQADIMRLLWTRGPATVREVHTWLTATAPLAYTTIMTTCERLAEKGLLEQRRVTDAEKPARSGKAYVYTPRLKEADFVRAAVERQVAQLHVHYPVLIQEQIAGFPPRQLSDTVVSDRASIEHTLIYLATLHDPAGQRVDAAVLDMIAALLDRAESAERTATTRAAEATSAEQQAQAAERRAEIAEQQLAALIQRTNRPPPPTRKKSVPSGSVDEYRDSSGICRVCANPAPPASAARHDDLRVCREAACPQRVSLLKGLKGSSS